MDLIGKIHCKILLPVLLNLAVKPQFQNLAKNNIRTETKKKTWTTKEGDWLELQPKQTNKIVFTCIKYALWLILGSRPMKSNGTIIPVELNFPSIMPNDWSAETQFYHGNVVNKSYNDVFFISACFFLDMHINNSED